MSKNPTALYLGIAALGAGGYYMYRAGGDPKVAKEEMRRMLLPFLFRCIMLMFVG